MPAESPRHAGRSGLLRLAALCKVAEKVEDFSDEEARRDRAAESTVRK
jgi:hypothetical protein